MMPTQPDVIERVSRIGDKLSEQGKLLGEVMTEHEVSLFENKHGIKLPEGYREFLLYIGNGGDGPPFYGCTKLGDAADDMLAEERVAWTTLPDIAKPFPFTRPWVWENDEVTDEGTDDQVGHGSLCIGNDGCGMYWHLIVTGPERGKVWMLCGEGITPTVPKRDFLQWYEDWLDGVENWFE